jgi:hypothetical protein
MKIIKVAAARSFDDFERDGAEMIEDHFGTIKEAKDRAKHLLTKDYAKASEAPAFGYSQVIVDGSVHSDFFSKDAPAPVSANATNSIRERVHKALNDPDNINATHSVIAKACGVEELLKPPLPISRRAEYSENIDSLIYSQAFRRMDHDENVALIMAILDQMNAPEGLRETVRALIEDYQPE